eukprot:5392581-Prymnesium_polylepis.1
MIRAVVERRDLPNEPAVLDEGRHVEVPARAHVLRRTRQWSRRHPVGSGHGLDVKAREKMGEAARECAAQTGRPAGGRAEQPPSSAAASGARCTGGASAGHCKPARPPWAACRGKGGRESIRRRGASPGPSSSS